MSLIHWWKLDGDLKDRGTNPVNLSYVNNNSLITQNTKGKIGICYERTSTANTDCFRTVNKIESLSGDLTMCCWAYVSTTPGDSANGLISNHSHSDNSGFGITVKQVSSTDYRISCSTGNGNSRTYFTYYGTTNIKDAWHHLCLTYKRSTQIFQLWVDGSVEYTSTEYNNKAISDYFDVFNWSTTYYSNAGYRPACRINDVRIYDHCLSKKEVRDLSKCLFVHYSLNFEDKMNSNGTYPTAAATWTSVDNNGYGGSASYNNIAINSSDLIMGNASAKFNGTNSYIEKFIPGNSPNYTCALWVKFDTTGTSHVTDCRNSAGTQGFQPFYGGLTYGIQFYSTNGGSLQPNASTCGWSSSDTDKWFHVVGVLTTTGCKLYINGQLKASNTATKSNPTVWGDLPLRLGTRLNGQNWFNGKIADAKVFLSELSADDILDLYQQKEIFDNHGNVYANEIVETSNSNIKMKKTSVIIASELIEEGNNKIQMEDTNIMHTNQFIEN